MSEQDAPRILFCTDTYPPQVNGVSVVTALSVAGLRARGWKVGVVAPRYPASAPNPFSGAQPGAGLEDELTTLANAGFPLYPDIRIAAPNYPAVAGAIRRFEPDIVHCETEFVIGRLGQIAAARAGIPLTTSYHTDFSRYTESYGVPWLRRTVSRYIGRFHGRARRTFTPSAPAREDVMRMGARDVEVWGRGVDGAIFNPKLRSAVLREAYGFSNAFTFVHVGRLAAEKGVETILDAYAIARGALPEGAVHLVIAGIGPCEEELRARAPRGVTFLGYLDRRTLLPRLYASADAFVFSSLTETLGLVVLEAMSCGLPVIATPAGGVADHLRDGENGIAFPPNDARAMASAMVRLAMDRRLATRLGRTARATAEALSWDAELDRLDHSYRQILGERSEGIAWQGARARHVTRPLHLRDAATTVPGDR
ncbi:MAG TPA: glycosyltransferase family 1 protein [Gemmatimonadaceae bacterium]|nr:glycosyltransferase family 1 protein [Gemmatimonadaceae bacterium]